ncbi:MAG: hypothetical protein ACOX69_06915 [Coriobacteriales bacterium]|jgi:hypothetical protein
MTKSNIGKRVIATVLAGSVACAMCVPVASMATVQEAQAASTTSTSQSAYGTAITYDEYFNLDEQYSLREYIAKYETSMNTGYATKSVSKTMSFETKADSSADVMLLFCMNDPAGRHMDKYGFYTYDGYNALYYEIPADQYTVDFDKQTITLSDSIYKTLSSTKTRAWIELFGTRYVAPVEKGDTTSLSAALTEAQEALEGVVASDDGGATNAETKEALASDQKWTDSKTKSDLEFVIEINNEAIENGEFAEYLDSDIEDIAKQIHDQTIDFKTSVMTGSGDSAVHAYPDAVAEQAARDKESGSDSDSSSDSSADSGTDTGSESGTDTGSESGDTSGTDTDTSSESGDVTDGDETTDSDADQATSEDTEQGPSSKRTPKAKSSFTVNVKTVTAKAVAKAAKKAHATKGSTTSITLGKKVKTIKKGAFKSFKRVKTITVKSKKLAKKRVKGALKGSKVKTVKVKVGSKKTNKRYVKKYKKYFSKKNCGKKVKVK